MAESACLDRGPQGGSLLVGQGAEQAAWGTWAAQEARLTGNDVTEDFEWVRVPDEFSPSGLEGGPSFRLEEYWLHLIALGCVPIRLAKKSGKYPVGKWAEFESMRIRVGDAFSLMNIVFGWLVDGYGAGFLVRGDFWVLDCDCPGAVEWVEQFLKIYEISCPKVKTNKGMHYYFRFPKDFKVESLKNHYHWHLGCDDELVADFKFGPQTLVVGPGVTRNLDDGNIVTYMPCVDWIDLPEVNPLEFSADAKIYSNDTENYCVDGRDLRSRIIRAKIFLAKYAKVSVAGSGGRSALLSVLSHLINYLRIPEMLALKYLNDDLEFETGRAIKSWNSRCKDNHGNSYPWSSSELCSMIQSVKSIPPYYGIKQYKEKQKLKKIEKQIHDFIRIIQFSQNGEIENISTKKLRKLFLEWSHIDECDCSETRFGRTVSKMITDGAARIKKIKSNGKMYYICAPFPKI